MKQKFYRASRATFSIILSLLIFTAANAKETDNNYYESAVNYLSSGNSNAAVIQLQNSLRENPKHLPSRLLLGEIRLRQGRGAAAEKEFKIAMDLGADRDRVSLSLGNAYLIQRKYSDIIDTIDISQFRHQQQPELLTLHGRAHFGLGHFEQAHELFDKAMEISPRAVGPILGKAALLISEEKLDQAEILADRARDLDSSNTEAWYLKGKLRTLNGDNEAALTAYDRVLELAPLHSRSRLARASLYLHSHQFELAKKDIDVVRTVRKHDPEAALLSHQIYQALGNKEKARSELEAAIDVLAKVDKEFILKQPGLTRVAALVHLMSGDPGQAEYYLEHLLKLTPTNQKATLLLGQVKLHLDDPQGAMKVLYPAYLKDRHNPELLYLLGDALLRMGKDAEASSMLEDAAQAAPRISAIAQSLALGKLGAGNTKEGIEELESVFLSESRESLGAGFILASIRVRQGQPEDALKIAETLLERHPKIPLVHNLVGAIQLSLKQTQKARTAFENALTHDPSFQPAHFNLAMLDMKENRLAASKKRYENILRHNPESADALLGLADIALAQGKQSEALALLSKAELAAPQSVTPKLRLISAYLDINELDKAAALASQTVQMFSEHPDAYEKLADTQSASGRKKDATTSYRKAAKYAAFSGEQLLRIAQRQITLEDYEGANLTLGNAVKTNVEERAVTALVGLKIKLGNPEGAKRYATAMVKRYPNQASGFNLLGDIALAQNAFSNAIDFYQKAHKKQPNTLSVLGLYKAYAIKGEHPKAFSVMKDWLKTHPNDRLIRRNLALGYLSTGRNEEAQLELEELVNSGDRGAVVLVSLASVYQQKNDPRAEDLARQALEANPDWSVALDTYGWILVNNDKADIALSYLREAVSRDSNALMRYHLAAALAQLGRHNEAKIELQIILRSHSSGPEAEQAEKLLNYLLEIK